MSEELKKLSDILFVCIMRYGLTQDKRFALAALVTYQLLLGSFRSQAIDDAERKIQELKGMILRTGIDETNSDRASATLPVFLQSAGLVETLKSHKTSRCYSLRSKMGLDQIAPELARAIYNYDVHAVNSFGDRKHAA